MLSSLTARCAALLALGYLACTCAAAEPWLAPGDLALRDDLLTLADAGLLRTSVMSWPVSWGSIALDLEDVAADESDASTLAALEAVRERLRVETQAGERFAHFGAALAEKPPVIRTFEDTPREDAQLRGGVAWTGDRFAARLNVTRVWDPSDGETVRLDGTYLGLALGNWMLSAGYPERWWGPGEEGSLILSTNARPMPQLAINRNRTVPFETRWLRWLGPWSLTSFMGELDDDRFVDGALLFGIRATARPLPRVEIALSRTAQWCGEGRPCGLGAFKNLLLGKDNTGNNISAANEPGNQLGGMDVRWSLPYKHAPDALYLQWIGEDSRQGGPRIGSWLRLLGVEFAGTAFGKWRHRSYFEAADTICREGGAGSGGKKFNCAYEHHIYQTGYRYEGRSIGHAMDGDGTMFSVGSTLQADRDRSWHFGARRIYLAQGDTPHPANTLATTPEDVTEISFSHSRALPVGMLHAGAGYRHVSNELNPLLSEHSYFAWLEFTVN
jgi:Capsule assembly protein Wzi